MHFWRLSYREYRELPTGLYNAMIDLQKEANRKSKKR
jgi:hypothetical protein